MTDLVNHDDATPTNRWRMLAWGSAAALLALPLIAMQFTDEVAWTTGDFLFAALLIGVVGLAFELAVRHRGDTAYRAGAGVALLSVFLLIWVNGAVGIIGSENNDANAMYLGVLAIALAGVVASRFRARGMAVAMAVTAGAVVLVALVAIVGGLGGEASGPLEIAGVNAFFVALFVLAAALFRRAAEGGAEHAG